MPSKSTKWKLLVLPAYSSQPFVNPVFAKMNERACFIAAFSILSSLLLLINVVLTAHLTADRFSQNGFTKNNFTKAKKSIA